MSTVAIIMATYNGEKYIREQLDSILNSTYQDFELFIYDDGSRDETMAILKGYEETYPTKLHVHQNRVNLGVTANFLQATLNTTLDYIMFCDQDDVWKPDKIAKTLKRIRNLETQLGKDLPLAVFTDTLVVDKELNILNNSFFCSNHLNPRKTDLPHILMENKLIGCTVMVNSALRKQLQAHRLPTQARFHDWWIAILASSMGKIGFLNEGTLLYRQHGGNVVGGNGFLPYVKNRITALQKQKTALEQLYRQAAEFLIIYEDELSEEKKKILQEFCNLEHEGFVKKRIHLIKYGFLKTGLTRNLGLIIII